MDPGSRGQQVSVAGRAIPWTRAALTWMLMMLVETGHGAVREIFLAPRVGALRADQVGVLVGSGLVLLVAWACSRWLNVTTSRGQLVVGAFWVALTLIFEVSLGRAMDMPWPLILSDYNPGQGGYMWLGLAVMFIAPWLTRRRT
jgi:hypothetical protein